VRQLAGEAVDAFAKLFRPYTVSEAVDAFAKLLALYGNRLRVALRREFPSGKP